MIREHRIPAGPRPANQSPTRLNRGIPDSRTDSPSKGSLASAPMLSASSANNPSLFSFGRNGATNEVGDPATSYDFLPSVSFDDLQSSLESASNDFKLTQFAIPTGQGTTLDVGSTTDKMAGASNAAQNGSSARGGIPPPVTRTGRSGSILGRPGTSSRQPSISSTASGPSSVADASTGLSSARPRRQSHYPPVSNTNIAKPPRKSIGSGVVETDFGSRTAQRRRPSLMANTGGAADLTRASIDAGAGVGFETPRNLANSRATKAKSMHQPLPRANTANLSTPDSTRLSTISPRSPRGGSKGNNSGSTQSRRQSVMPGMPHASHASGLGARTISPTDTRRMKRMSMHQPPSLNQAANAPPPPPLEHREHREHSRSPSMIPRKASATPSSSRTTPDINRKSYSSGLSITSTNSFNTVRTSTGSIQPRVPATGAASRLPAPKSSTTHNHNSHSAEDEEEVPPVPAIPKAYESPQHSATEASFLDKRKANLAADASSINSNSTGSFSIPSLPEPAVTVSRKASTRKSTNAAALDAEKKGNASSQSRRNPQPVRLPPITVGPLNPSTSAKIAALGQNGPDRNLSPPPSRIIAKTPTTPMTASKSSFFSRNRTDEKSDVPNLRSNSTVYHTRLDSASGAEGTSSSESFAAVPVPVPFKPTRKPSVSPFLSSSVPKPGADPAFLKRSQTGDLGSTTEPLEVKPHLKPSGPRAQRAVKGKSPTPPVSDPEEPPTPSSMSSLRRKLSLSWKRNTSKSDSKANASEKVVERSISKEQMPPPRLPISATVGNLSSAKNSPSPSVKANNSYLESRRRKSSAASLGHDRTKSENWTSASVPKTPSDSHPHNPSVMQKILRPKASTTTMRQHDPWTAELDKDDLVAEDEMKKMGSRRKETEIAARTLDALRKRATPKERVGAQEAIRIAMLNIYERGEIVDYNDIYFCGTQNARKVIGDLQSDAPNFGYDDERGDYTIVPGDHLAYRYEIIDILGKGSFGQVVRCIDHKTGVLVAVKIIRNKKRFHQQALVEVNILQKLREWDPKNRHSMVNFTHSFYFRGHLCISTELLDMNLYEFIKANAFRGFSLKLIRRFTKQMLSSLNLLKQHKVIHCDLKPENILLRHPLHSEIKVIDFGSSCFENEKVYTYIQSRFYRSPEVILGMTYGMPIDMWSLGCILAELYTGVPIFPGENEQEQLACIMEVFGPPEKHLIEKSTRKKLFFDSMGKPRLTVSSKGRRRRPSSKTLQQALKCDDEAFLDFLAKCLRWDPDRRLKPEEAIHHEFVSGKKVTAPLPRVSATRDASPVKRHTVAAPRPLPEPPAAGIKNGIRSRDVSGASPHKPVSGASSRRPSVATSGTVHVATAKRTSTGQGGVTAGTSSLPRAAIRTVSAKQDLASAGATAAMSRRGL
ncbi:Putative serine/threonine-protein kinase, active [Colletotrichum destructivum]|uniref:Serine/threonine-protein kinase, active n=1 Tax=Colletotrichum destructivum TaxID=34406 RepID=A0AAX4J0P0_9PEZI|nr:Putative serine/threonine-protein kinase, active [Colletotrichum destructivum]